MKNTVDNIRSGRRWIQNKTLGRKGHAVIAAVLAAVIILGWVMCGTGCAATQQPDLEALHRDITAREGTPHFDHWSPDAQAQWETAFRQASR